jgi:outer membrane protein assembly factor BamB
MTRLKPCILFLGASLCASLAAQSPQVMPPAQTEENKAERVTQSSDDFYNNNPVFNLRLASSSPLWMKNLVQEGLKTYHPFFERDRILLGDGEWLYSLDLGTGAIDWKHQFDRELDDFSADGDLLVYTDHRFGLMGGKSWVHAFSFKSGKQLWEHDFYLGVGFQFSRDHVYRYTLSAFGNATLHSLDREGKEEWAYKTKGVGQLFFFGDLVVTCPPGEKRILALNAKTGTEAWRIPFDGDAWEMAYHGGVFYGTYRTVTPVVNMGGTVYVNAIDLKSGKTLWSFKTEADDGWFHEQVGGIVSDGSNCVLNTNRRLIGLDARTGKQVWMANPEKKESYLPSKPIILNGRVFAIQVRKNKESVLQFLNLKTGSEEARMEAKDEVLPPAKVVGRSLFLCFRHGDMLALPLVDAE